MTFVDDVPDDLGLRKVLFVVWIAAATGCRREGGRRVVDNFEVICVFAFFLFRCWLIRSEVVFGEVGGEGHSLGGDGRRRVDGQDSAQRVGNWQNCTKIDTKPIVIRRLGLIGQSDRSLR